MTEKILLKDSLFNKLKVSQIAKEILLVYPQFKKEDFINEAVSKFPELELKARITWMAECLKKYLPTNYREAVNILISSLPKPSNPELTDNDFGDFIYAPYGEFVAKNGCNKEYLQFSLQALKEITTRFSAEDSIRYFINAFSKETISELINWTADSHYHVRRLCSEGTRPKLPWSMKINIPATIPLPILERLYTDKTRFVTRSVANHLNDISKIDPDLVIKTLSKWKKTGEQNEKEMDYITRHALRTLIKTGNVQALELLGFFYNSEIIIYNFVSPKKIKIGSVLEFSFDIKSSEDTDVVIDYIIYFQNKLGKLANKKIFKLKKIALVKDKVVSISKHHSLREGMTTRTFYPGHHELDLQVNGKIYHKAVFELE